MKNVIINGSFAIFLTFLFMSCVSQVPNSLEEMLEEENPNDVSIVTPEQSVGPLSDSSLVVPGQDEDLSALLPSSQSKLTNVKSLISHDNYDSVPLEQKDANNIRVTLEPSVSMDWFKKHYYKGNYEAVIKKDKQQDLIKRYYQAMSYYCLSLNVKRGSPQKKTLIKKAKLLFEQIAFEAEQPYFKAKNILWYGILSYAYPSKQDTLWGRIRPFTYIRRTYTSRSVFYNDALFYTARLYEQVNNIAQARLFYERLMKTAKKDPIYDVHIQKLVSPEKAASYYLNRLRSRVAPQEASLKNVASDKNTNLVIASNRSLSKKAMTSIISPKESVKPQLHYLDLDTVSSLKSDEKPPSQKFNSYVSNNNIPSQKEKTKPISSSKKKQIPPEEEVEKNGSQKEKDSSYSDDIEL